jgi:hypothetical protein
MTLYVAEMFALIRSILPANDDTASLVVIQGLTFICLLIIMAKMGNEQERG